MRGLRWMGLMLASLALAGHSAAEQVRVMTFNLRYINKEDLLTRAWSSRRDQAAELIKREHPDLIGVQEALRPMLDDLEQRLDGYIEIGAGRADGLMKGEYCALLVRADRFSVQEAGTFWLSATPEIPGSATWGNEVVRICTWARLMDRKTGWVFHFYNTHLDHRSQEAREKGIALILDRIATRQPAGSYLLSGDLNAGESNPVHELVRNSDIKPVDVWKSFNPGTPASESGTVHGFSGKTDGERIDYIYASPDLKILESKIVHDAKDGAWPSDHFPVRAVFEIPAQARF